MKGGNRRGFISQVNQLIAILDCAEAVSGHNHRELTRKSTQGFE